MIGLLQVALITLAGVTTAVLTDALDVPVDVVLGSAGWLIVWFLIGYFSYALLFATLAALVSHQEDVGTVTVPVTVLLTIPYFIVFIGIRPGETISPIVERGLVALTWLGGRTYRYSVLRTGARIKLRSALRGERA